jgi:hypothetical protein
VKPTGTLAQVKAYWNAYPDRFSAAWHQLHPGKRQPASVEIFPHLSSAPDRASLARASAPQAPWRASAGAAPVRAPSPARTGGLFVDPGQTERAAVSPLGGKIW